ncbi:hypothetical protein BDF14DRAFT_1733729 [Spinellus fusiger]|nr:hypothetical protein BDF14DRAFT_1733729 [Spinellus fusiger]
MNSRSKTLPCFPSNTSDKRRSTSTSHAVPANYFLPTPTKESLEEWLYKSTNTNTTNTTTTPPHSLSPGYSLLEVCYCCEQSDCKSLVSLNKTMRKLESETRLAAEIGQSLLQKHEAHVLDTNHRTQALKNQLNTAHEKVAQLEQSLEESENSKQETVADLETVNAKCTQLTQDLDVKYSQVEKLQVFKLMVRQADIREETLRCKLEDMSQELAVSRKHELMLEAKQKKLLSKFGKK